MTTPLSAEARTLGKAIAEIFQRIEELESGTTVAQMPYSSVTNSAIPFFDADGNLSATVGTGGVLLTDPNGAAQLSIDATGGANTNGVNIVDYLNYRGQEFSDHLNSKSTGLVAWITFNGVDTSVTTTSLGIAQLDFPIEEGKAYEIFCSPTLIKLNTGTAGTNASSTELRYTTDGSDPLTTSTLLSRQYGYDNESYTPNAFFVASATTTLKVLLAFTSVGGAGIYANTNVSQPLSMWVSEVAYSAPPSTGRRTNGLGGGVTPQQYVTTYTATWSRSWSAKGINNGTNLVQGNYHDSFGDWKALFGFDYDSIATDLNASTILKAELFLYCNNAINNDGGYARLRTNSIQDPPPNGLYYGISATRLARKFSKPGSYWIDLGTTIGDEFRTGVSRSFGLDATDISPRNNADAVWFNSAIASVNRPQLRFTYVT